MKKPLDQIADNAAPAGEARMNREAWLNAVAGRLLEKVVAAGGERPEKLRVSCGWPSRSALMRASAKSRRIGECWSGGSEDGAREIFISPALAHPVEVADVLLHELIHACLPAGTGHGPAFKAVMKKVGLTGKATATVAGEELAEELKTLTAEFGPYAHAKLDATPAKKQGTRMMKIECPDCGYTLRTTRVWIEQGLPTCACGAEMESVEYAAGGEPLNLEGATLTYKTKDGRFTLRVSKSGRGDQPWIVTDHEAVELETREVGGVELTEYAERWTYRRGRADALGFIEALRSGELTWDDVAVVEADDDHEEHDEDALDDLLGPIGEWGQDDDYLGDDEDEEPDYEDGHLPECPEELARFEAEERKRDLAGAAKSERIAKGSEEAMD